MIKMGENMKSIFEIENRLNIQVEFEKMFNEFQVNSTAVMYREDNNEFFENGTLVNAIDSVIFLKWKYRDTFLSVDEYLEHLGIPIEIFYKYGPGNIGNEYFLYYIEFWGNMQLLIREKGEHVIELSPKIEALFHNMKLILEKMNYKFSNQEDRIIITKRCVDVDATLNMVSKDISQRILEYYDFRIEKNIYEKRKILKDIDLYIENNIDAKSLDREADGTIGVIVNKMGINHPIKEEKYKNLSDEELLKWYDKCFLLMLYIIRKKEVKSINEERKNLDKDNII